MAVQTPPLLWPAYASHHSIADQRRCFEFRDRWVCRRCAALVVGTVAWRLVDATAAFAVNVWILAVVPVGALVDLLASHRWPASYSPNRVVGFSVLAGFAAAGVARTVLDRDPHGLAVFSGWTVTAIAAFIWIRRSATTKEPSDGH